MISVKSKEISLGLFDPSMQAVLIAHTKDGPWSSVRDAAKGVVRGNILLLDILRADLTPLLRLMASRLELPHLMLAPKGYSDPISLVFDPISAAVADIAKRQTITGQTYSNVGPDHMLRAYGVFAYRYPSTYTAELFNIAYGLN